MKTIITLLTATMLVAGATAAMAADRQSSDEAFNNNLSWQAARGARLCVGTHPRRRPCVGARPGRGPYRHLPGQHRLSGAGSRPVNRSAERYSNENGWP